MNKERPADFKRVARESQQPATATHERDTGEVEFNAITIYLIFYNWISAVLWVSVLGTTLLTLTLQDYTKVYEYSGQLTKWTQTVAFLEIMHSAFHMVRAPLFTTIMQVSSRFVLVWIIVDNFPHLAESSVAYSSMLLAWSVTEVIRYSYFTNMLAFGSAPDWLKWLRYNGFTLLYPVGISSEVWLVILALGPARQIKPIYEWGLYAVLAFYVPGSYILFTHMLKQRKKVKYGKDLKKKSK